MDPWRALRDPEAQSKPIEVMKSLGLHVLSKQLGDAGLGVGRAWSTSVRETCLRLIDGEELRIPVQTCTTVLDVKCMLSDKLMVPIESLSFVYRQGCSSQVHRDGDQISSKVIVKGLRSFKYLPHEWPHPIAVLGAGYNGIKAGMKWIRGGSSNFVIFDKHSRVGGTCWIDAANKTSKLQTEFAAFHVWYGPEFGGDARCGGIPVPDTWEFWPRKERVLWHFQHAAEEYGLLPHCRLSVGLDSLVVAGKKTDHHRYYELTATHVKSGESETVTSSGLLGFPGSMAKNRIIDYPGEESFGGRIGYGMSDDLPYDNLAGSQTAVLGNGAFAIENCRTSCEYGADKVFLVTRRMNLASPRVPCWFVHQASVPVPGGMLLRLFEPMYRLAGLGNPFDFWSVHGSETSTSVTISQNSRFGIGDVTFLAVAWGKLEFVEATVKRLTSFTVHLTTGTKLANISNIVKALGLVADPHFDKLQRMTKLVGFWCDGDFRRPVQIDPPGMHAANFETMATGLPSFYIINTMKFLFDFPKEYNRAEAMGLLQMLPQNKAQGDRPIYVFDVKYAMMAGPMVASFCPKLAEVNSGVTKYKHDAMHKAHPLKEYLQTCIQEWDAYQKAWKEQGCEHEYVPYPYTQEMVEAWIDVHQAATGHVATEDSQIPVMNSMEEAAYQEGSALWWQQHYPEAWQVWTCEKRAMKFAFPRSHSASHGSG